MTRVWKISLVVLLAVPLALTLALSTLGGQAGLLRLASKIASSDDSVIGIGVLDGSLFGNGTIADITLSDRDGVWLKAKGISFSWSPFQLLSGRLAITYLRVHELALLRKPETGRSEPGAKQGGVSGFEVPVRLALDEFDVRAFSIAEAVLAEAVKLRVTGSANVEAHDGAATARLHVARLDALGATFDTKVALMPATRSLTVTIDGRDPEGGLVSRLLGLPTRPGISLNLDGRGTLDAWNADLSLFAAGKPLVAGNIQLAATDGDMHRLSGAAAGYFAWLVPHAAAELFRDKTELRFTADVVGLGDGELRSIENARLVADGANLHVEATGGADLAGRYFHGHAEGRAGRADGLPLHFDLGGPAELAIREVTFSTSLPDTLGPRRLVATARVGGFTHPQLAARDMTISIGASQPQPIGASASVLENISMDLAVIGIDETLAAGKALGSEGRATLAGYYNGKVLSIAAFDVKTAVAAVGLSGTLDGALLDGKVRFRVNDLARLSAIAGRPITGRADLQVAFEGNFEKGVISAAVQGITTGLGTGSAAIDRLFAPQTRLSGRFEREASGALVAHDVTLANARVTAELSGEVDAAGTPALSGHVALASLADFDAALSGEASLDVVLTGAPRDLHSDLTATGENVKLNGRHVEKPFFRFSGHGPLTQHQGKFALAATIAGEPVAGSADVMVSDSGSFSVSNLAMDFAGAKLAGRIALGDTKHPTGHLMIDARNLERVGNAIGVRLRGNVVGTIDLADDGTGGAAKLDLTAHRIEVGELWIEGVRATGDISNYHDFPVGAFGVRVERVSDGAKTLEGLGIVGRFDGQAAKLTSKGRFDGGTIYIAASTRTVDGAPAIDIVNASYTGRSSLPVVRLAEPARLSWRDGRLMIGETQVAIGDGHLRLSGWAGAKALDVTIALQNIPASVAAVTAPDLGVQGTIYGSACVTGDPAEPIIDAKISAIGLSTRFTRSSQLPSIDLTTTVKAAANSASVGVRASGRSGLNLTLDGTVALKAEGELVLIGRGEVPLSLVNVVLAERATRIGGLAKVTARISGTRKAPRIEGSLAVNGASASDPKAGLDLSSIDANIGFTQDQISISKLFAASRKGGSVTAGGTVLLHRDAAPVADVSIKLDSFKFGNQNPVAGEVYGDVTISGPLSALAAGGDVHIRRMDVTIPNQLPRSLNSLDIRHVNPPSRFRSAESTPASRDRPAQPGPSVILAVNVHAADRIFIRGRGLDAQLGGDVRIRGTADKPVTDGKFGMSRGRLSIIGRQLDFSRGNIVFAGSPEPSLDMEAKADADGTTVIVRVTGPASEPKFKFSSSPELPEDEIVSLLLFNKKLAKLSPPQVIQLASTIDTIGGLSSGPSTLDKMKSALGLDVFDVSTDEKGNAQATAGSYIDDKTYVGVKQGTSLGTGRVVIDHSLTKHLKARGEAGASGDSKIGLGFEFEY